MAKLVQPTIERQKSIMESLKPSIRIANSIRESIVPSLKLIENWQQQFIPLFDKSLIDNLIEWQEKVKSSEYQAFIKEWGWFFSKKTYSFGDYCFGLYKKFGAEKFSNRLTKWFLIKENMSPFIEEIRDHFPLRVAIINDGINFHLRGNYASAITLMLPHAEGVLWKIGQKKGVVESKYTSEKIVENNVVKSKKWKLSRLAKKLFPHDRFHEIIVKEIFCAGPRDRILHGRNIYKGKQKEVNVWLSTLLILTMWRLADEIRIIDE